MKVAKCLSVAISLAAALSGCANRANLDELPTFTHTPPQTSEPSIQITYTGTAGALIQLNDHAIMLDPYFSNISPSIFSLFSRPSPDADTVDALLPDISAVSGILIGHGHQDHLLDAAYVLSKAPAQAKIYGSETTTNIVASLVEKERRVSLNHVMATHDSLGQWVSLDDAHIRIMAIASEHAPQIGPILLNAGYVKSEQERVPRQLGWKAGQALTYLVDFLKAPTGAESATDNIVYRVYLQSSASGAPLGPPPTELLSLRPVDLALLCVASFENVNDYPQHVLRAVKPKSVMLVHWDNFLKSRLDAEVEALSRLDIAEFIRRTREVLGENNEILMPMPGTQFSLPITQ